MYHEVLLLVCVCMVGGVRSLDYVHHGNADLETYLLHLNTTYPHITHVYSIGKSIRNQELWVIAIGKDPRDYVELRPNVKYVGNMHGNEVVSREILIQLVDHYVTSYGINSTITAYLNTTLVHILPSMNPDGYDMAQPGACGGVFGRYNLENIDLNRNFPDLWHGRQQNPRAIETLHVMDWIPKHTFVLSANLHGGAMVANYPYDQYENANARFGDGPSLCPDSDVFKFLALTYSRSHWSMAATNGTQCKGDYFKDGVVNGVEWYVVGGGMQDYNYLKDGVFEITIEVSCCKYPLASTLENYWNENRDALINYNFEVHRGIKGLIKDVNNNPIQGAVLTIQGRESVNFHSSKHGEYFRILRPGNYTLKVSADQYMSASKVITVTDGEPTRQDITLILAPTSGATSIQDTVTMGIVHIVQMCIAVCLVPLYNTVVYHL